jgi:murein L,D-transpeptidase YcbB/YkuD
MSNCLFSLIRLGAIAALLACAGAAGAVDMAFRQALATAAHQDEDVAAFYRDRSYLPVWTGTGPVHAARRAALVETLARAGDHGLPPSRYPLAEIRTALDDPRTVLDLANAELTLTQAYLRYARDVQSGVLVPRTVDAGLVREIVRPDTTGLLSDLAASDQPRAFLRDLAPPSLEYRRLLRARLDLLEVIAAGGWGEPVRGGDTLEPGDQGARVLALRDRLIAMGYLPMTARVGYTPDLTAAVRAFQTDHGLEVDGVAGPATLAEINENPEDRLAAVLVALERERWLPRDLGDRHVIVNLADFRARIVDDGAVTFETRTVVGKNTPDRRSPEFSDVMEFMVINPSWYVPRSIVTQEYLPKLRNNPWAVGHIEITDSRGRRVDRGAANFAAYSARNFPYSMRQPPGQNNALGLVKFMFPNPYNIYMHDTPQKQLFDRETRAFSHGCIRLADPFDFAYALLARQEADPAGFFHRVLETGRETRVELVEPVPVHLTYRTAVSDADGRIVFRRDVYGRDGRIWDALRAAGVEVSGIRG